MVARTTTTPQPAAPSPGPPAHPTKIKQLLQAVSKQQPFAAATRPEQAVRWRLVHNAVWKGAPATFEVQSKFTMLMAIPASNQRTFVDWDDEMYELYDALAQQYPLRRGSVRTTASGPGAEVPPTPATETEGHVAPDHTTTPVNAEAHGGHQDETTTRSASTAAEEAGETDQRDAAAARPAPTDTNASRGHDDDTEDDEPRRRRAPPASADSGRRPKRRCVRRDAESKEEAEAEDEDVGDDEEEDDDDDDDTDSGDKAVGDDDHDAPGPTPAVVPAAATALSVHDINLARAILEFEPHKDRYTNAAWKRVSERLGDQGYPHKRSIAGLKLQFGKLVGALVTPQDKAATEMRTLLQEYGKSEGVQLTRSMQGLVGATQQASDRRPHSVRAPYDKVDAGAAPKDQGHDGSRRSGRRAEAMPARARGEDIASGWVEMSAHINKEIELIQHGAENGMDKELLLKLLIYRKENMPAEPQP